VKRPSERGAGNEHKGIRFHSANLLKLTVSVEPNHQGWHSLVL
jgi:hypothetical protein